MIKFIERFLTLVSGVITIFQFLISISPVDIKKVGIESVNLQNLVNSLSLIMNQINNFSAYQKFFIFILLEVANAYFFAHLFFWIKRSKNTTITNLLFYILVIFPTTFISLLFLLTVIFTDKKSIFVFSICFLISMIITVIFFFCKTEKENMEININNNIIGETLVQMKEMPKQLSFWFLIVTYVAFYFLFLYDYMKMSNWLFSF